MNKQELFETDLTNFLETNKIDRKNITIRTPPTKIAGEEILCAICCSIIAAAIWDGIKWVWTYYSHKCTPPVEPKPQAPTPTPECCPTCGAQLVPGKKHYCE